MANHIPDLVDYINNSKHAIMGQGLRRGYLDMLAKAECFDFGVLPLEVHKTDKGEDAFEVPSLTDDEVSFYKERLLPFPAPICMFEYKIYTRTCIILDNRNKDYMAMHVVDLSVLEHDYGAIQFGMRFTHNWETSEVFVDTHPDLNSYFQTMPAAMGQHLEAYVSIVQLAMYLNLMLNSKTTEVRKEIIAPKLNKARIKRGKTPFRDHTIVTVVPKRYITMESVHVNGRCRLSPRLHWRRSHPRTIKATGKRYVVARHLVGKRELGEVTHEYIVKP